MYRLELDSVTLDTVLVSVKRSDVKHGCEPWLLRGEFSCSLFETYKFNVAQSPFNVAQPAFNNTHFV